MYTAYWEASRRSPLSRFSKTVLSPPQLSDLANDDVTLVSGTRILPLRFETAKVPAAPSTPVRPAKATAEKPRAPIQASRYRHTQYYETTQCSPLSRRSKAPSQQLPSLVNVDVPAAPSTPVQSTK